MRALRSVVGVCGLALGLLTLTGNEARAVEKYQVRPPSYPQGVEVLQVFRNSPADRAGLERGDIITEVNGTPVQDFGHFRSLMARSRGIVELTVIDHRTGQIMTLDVNPQRGTIGIYGRTAHSVGGPKGSQAEG
jgi:S1-C subfamily serine protease